MVMVRLRVSLQGINVSQCNVCACVLLPSTATCSQWAWSAAGSCCTGGALARSLLEDTTGAAVEKRTFRILYNTHTHGSSEVQFLMQL